MLSNGARLVEHLAPFAAIGADAHARPVAQREGIGAAQRFAGPLRFGLDLGIARELRARRYWQAEIDGIAIVATGKAEPQGDRGLAHCSLHRLLAALHRARKHLPGRPTAWN